MDHRLARGSLPGAALDHVPHDHVIDQRRIDPGAADRFLDGQGTQAGCGKRGEPAQIFPDRGAAGTEDDSGCGVGHRQIP